MTSPKDAFFVELTRACPKLLIREVYSNDAHPTIDSEIRVQDLERLDGALNKQLVHWAAM